MTQYDRAVIRSLHRKLFGRYIAIGKPPITGRNSPLWYFRHRLLKHATLTRRERYAIHNGCKHDK